MVRRFFSFLFFSYLFLSTAFGSAYGVSTDGRAALLCYGPPGDTTFEGYSLISVALDKQQIISTKRISTAESLPELGSEIGGEVEKEGLAIFGNRDADGNRLTMIYYYDVF